MHRAILFVTTIATATIFVSGGRCAAENTHQREAASANAKSARGNSQTLAMAQSRCVPDKNLQASIRSASDDKLRSGLRHSDACVRKSVVVALGRSTDEAWLADLTAACKDVDAEVRASAAIALARILEANRPRGFKDADARFVQSLIGLLQDRSQNVRRAAAESLQFISGMELDYSPGYWKAWWEDGVSLRKG